jgi:acyl-CoA synthetase (AMP-forming)/AMP-acid ligase II
MTGVITAGGLAAAFREQVRAHPQRTAVALVRDPDKPDATASWTYARLHQEASAVAARLTRRGRPGDRLLLTYPSGPEFAAAFLGCLYAGLVAVPAPLPARSRQQKRRLTAIARDAGVAAVLARSDDREIVEDWLSAGELAGTGAVYTDDLPPAPAHGGRGPAAAGNGIAFLQYTSGSTGDAKGVVLTEDNVLTNARILYDVTGLPSEQIRVVCWLPLYHDMGLIGQLLSPLIYGGTSFLLDPVTFVRRPFTWLRTIDQYRATVSAAPDFAFSLCVDRITDEQVARLDLSSWRMATNGADWLNLSVMRRFTERFAPAGFRADLCPAYGLAEATLMVTSRRARELRVLDADRTALDAGAYVPAEPAEAKQIVSCGPPREIDLEIVDPDTLDTLPEDQVGEIWLRGRSVARGYWGREEQTRQMFGVSTAAGQRPYLRTGDLGFRHDGELYVTGRLKEVIVVRGLKIYPQDIESAVRAEVPELTGLCAAFRLPGAREEDPDRVVLTQEVRDTPAGGLSELAQRAVHVVAKEFGAQVAAVLFLNPGGIQRTTSGKVKRVEMRERYLAGALQPVHEYTS